MAASGLPSPSRSAQAKPRIPEIPANGWIARNVPSPLLRNTVGNPSARTRHDVEVAIGFDVDRPCSGVTGFIDRPRQFGLRGHVGETRRGCPGEKNVLLLRPRARDQF